MFKKDSVSMAAILAASIAVVAIVAHFAGGLPTWPGYFLVLLFFLGKCERRRELLDVFCGGAVGIVWALGCSALTAALECHVGFPAALGVTLLAGIFALAMLGDVNATFFNNYAFVYYLIASLFSPQQTAAWLFSLVVFGGLFALLVFGGMRLFVEPRRKASMPDAVERTILSGDE